MLHVSKLICYCKYYTYTLLLYEITLNSQNLNGWFGLFQHMLVVAFLLLSMVMPSRALQPRAPNFQYFERWENVPCFLKCQLFLSVQRKCVKLFPPPPYLYKSLTKENKCVSKHNRYSSMTNLRIIWIIGIQYSLKRVVPRSPRFRGEFSSLIFRLWTSTLNQWSYNLLTKLFFFQNSWREWSVCLKNYY